MNARHIQVTTKTPSAILKHLLSGESLSRQDPINGLSIWLSLSNVSQQRQRSQQQQYHQQQLYHQQQQNLMLRKGSQNYQESFQIVLTTAMPHLDSQTLQEMLGATQAKVSASQPAGGSNAWQVNAGNANRHSEINSQVTEMRNGALPDPYNPTGQHSVLPSGDFGVAEQRQKALGSNHMGLSAASADRPAGAVTLADLTGPEVGQSGATVPGIGGILNNSFTGPDSGRNLQTTGPSFMKQGVVPQNFVVSEQTPPMGNPVEQVFNEPWNLQVQETAPVVEAQPVGQAFQYYEPHQPQNNFDPMMSQNRQFEQQQQQQLVWDALGSPGALTANTERFMDTASFQQYQDPIDHHTLEALQPPQIAYQHQDIVQVDSNNGNFDSQQQQQQLSSLFQIINMHQSFTDPFADNMTSMLGPVFSEANHNFSTPVPELPASENVNSTWYNPGLNSLFQNLKHVSATESLNETNCCPETNKSLSTEYYNPRVHHSQNGVLKRLSHVDSSHPDLATLISNITIGSRYLSRSSGQSKPLYLFTSKFKLPKQNRSNSVQNRSTQSAFPNDRSVAATASGYEKPKVVQPAIAGDPPHGQHLADTGDVIDQAKPHLVVDSYSIQVQTQQPISQIHSGISSSNDSPSDTAFLQQAYVT